MRENQDARKHGGREEAARSSLDLRDAPLRWTSQGPTNVATVAQVPARRGAARSSLDLRGAQLRWTSQDSTKVATITQVVAHKGAARSSLDLRGATPLGLPGTHEWRKWQPAREP